MDVYTDKKNFTCRNYAHATKSTNLALTICNAGGTSQIGSGFLHCILQPSSTDRSTRRFGVLDDDDDYTARYRSCGAVYCNRSYLWVCVWVCVFVGVFVCGSVTTITRNCVHRSLPNWVCW